MNKNFLNNQNYILGKTEKKKLLSKFFVENRIKQFYILLNLISDLIFNWKILFLIPIFAYITLLFFSDNFWLKIIFWIVSFIFMTIFFIYFFFKSKIKNKHKIYNIKDFFLKKWKDFNVVFILWLVKYLFIFSFLSLIWKIWSWGITFYIFFILFILSLIFLIRINLLNLILFPFILIYMFFYGLLKYIIWNKNYLIYKKRFKIDYFSKFDYIDLEKAENNYYKITKKQWIKTF